MTPQAKIAALRAALEQISQTSFGWDGDCGTTRIADEALSLTADDAEQAPDLDDALSAVLWLYHRLPRGYDRQAHIERVVRSLATATGSDGERLLLELGHHTPDPAPVTAKPMQNAFSDICLKNDGYGHTWRGRTVESQTCVYCGIGWPKSAEKGGA